MKILGAGSIGRYDLGAETEVKDGLMHTSMSRKGDLFTTEIVAPAGTRLDFGFYIQRTEDLLDKAWPDWPAWDWNGGKAYQLIASEDRTVEMEAPLSLRGYLSSIDFGRTLIFAIGLLFAAAALGIATFGAVINKKAPDSSEVDQ